MLVLTRGLNEEIVIDGNIRIKVLKIAGNHVRLGFAAPEGIPVVRQELLERDAEQLAARGPVVAAGQR
jgi:carbon storage regulator CsrA